MVTKQQALEASEFHWGNCTRAIGKRGGVTERVQRARRSGRTQTWQRDESRWRVPIKIGFKGYGNITPERAHEWHVPEDCPLRHTDATVGVAHHMGRIQPVSIPMSRTPFYRAVCTCNYAGTEHILELEARIDLAKHMASQDAGRMPETLTPQ